MQILQAVVSSMMIQDKNIKATVFLTDGDTELFDIVIGILQRDILLTYIFITCLENVI